MNVEQVLALLDSDNESIASFNSDAVDMLQLPSDTEDLPFPQDDPKELVSLQLWLASHLVIIFRFETCLANQPAHILFYCRLTVMVLVPVECHTQLLKYKISLTQVSP